MSPSSCLVTRAQAVVLRAAGVPLESVHQQTGLSIDQICTIYSEAINRGWRSDRPLLNFHVQDQHHGAGTSPPREKKKKLSVEQEEELLAAVTRGGRLEKICGELASRFGVPAGVVGRTLRRRLLAKADSRGVWLTRDMELARVFFCMRYSKWTVEDWKKVVWTGETDVVVKRRRRSAPAVWIPRRPNERAPRSCVREQWKSRLEFKFWGCFSYDFKGPCYIWKPETKEQKEAIAAELLLVNKALKSEARKQREYSNETQSKTHGVLNHKELQTKWRFNKKKGAIIRFPNNRFGIDWWRYLHEILLPKLLPFGQAIKCFLPDIIIQDNAAYHPFKYKNVYFDASNIQRFLWPDHSPDLDILAPCWAYLKRTTTEYGPLTSRRAAEQAWVEAWEDLEQWRIQAWIERIPGRIQEIIRAEGGNGYLYAEGVDAFRQRLENWKLQLQKKREKGKESKKESSRSSIRRRYGEAFQAFEAYASRLPPSYRSYLPSLFQSAPSQEEIEEVGDDVWGNDDMEEVGVAPEAVG